MRDSDTIRRCYKLSPLAAALATLFACNASYAGATSRVAVPVTSCLDDGSPGTLRTILSEAAGSADVDLGGLTCNTITLTQGPIDMSPTGPHPLGFVTIRGPTDAVLTIDGGGTGQVFVHGNAPPNIGSLKITHLTIAHGHSTSAQAACIASSGNVSLDHVTVTDCHTSASVQSVQGGAIGVLGNLEVTSSTISASSAANAFADAAGGGMFVGGQLLLTDSVVNGNSVSGTGLSAFGFTGGGGVFAVGDIHIVESTISANAATGTQVAYGGGVLGSRNIVLERSLVTGNTSSFGGGGVSKSEDVNDIDPHSRGVTIVNTTISGNSAQLDGGLGGLYALTIENSTITGNHATHSTGGVYFLGFPDALLIHSSIIANNTAADTSSHAADLSTANGGPFTAGISVAGNSNLIASWDALITVPSDTLVSDPMLGPLADNGGPTLSHALLPGSPAIDAGDNFFGLPTDQRGAPRVAGPGADIGAFELAQPAYDTVFANGFD